MDHVLYLVRHGIAENPVLGASDAERRLTPEGIEKMREVSAGLREFGTRLDAIVSSPYIRARQTAEILAGDFLADAASVELHDGLACGCDPEEMLTALPSRPDIRHIALVGHEPCMGALASYLLCGVSERLHIPFKKGGMLALGVASLPPRNPATLLWFMTPGQLRRMAR